MGYKALKDIKLYKSPTTTKGSFTIKKGTVVNAVATYSKGSNKYIQVYVLSKKNDWKKVSSGWLKVSSLYKMPTSMFKNIMYNYY